MTLNQPKINKLDKAEGSMLALAAGDALGWPQEIPAKRCGGVANQKPSYEFQSWVRRSGSRFQQYEELINPGSYSDDTQLALAVARARTEYLDSWWHAFTKIELPLWSLYQRGGGGATLRAVRAWTQGCPPWSASRIDERRKYFNAGGNGVAMRILPHVIYYANSDDPTTLLRDVILDGSATHGHPRALVGAAAYAYAAWSAMRLTKTLGFGELLDLLLDTLNIWGTLPVHNDSNHEGVWFERAEEVYGTSFQELWTVTQQEMVELIEEARRGIRAGALSDDSQVLRNLGCFGREKGCGTVTAAAAVYLVSRYATHPAQGVLMAAFENGVDTDTIAAMVGGLAGALTGTEQLPASWSTVQDEGYIRGVSSRLIEAPADIQHQPIKVIKNPKSIFDQLETAECGSQFIFADRMLEVIGVSHLKPLTKSLLVRSWCLRTTYGQTLFVNKTQKNRNDFVDTTSLKFAKDSETTKSTTVPRNLNNELNIDDLYSTFRRVVEAQLNQTERLSRKEIQSALNIVPSQEKQWVERALQEKWLVELSEKPKQYGLNSEQLFPTK